MEREGLTVSELIERLRKIPGDLPVLCDDDTGICEVLAAERKILGKEEVCWLKLVWTNAF